MQLQLQRLIEIAYAELPSRFAARLESRLRQEAAAGRLGTTPPRPAPTLAEIMRELPLHGHRLDLTAAALGTTEAKVRGALGDRLKPPKPKTPEASCAIAIRLDPKTLPFCPSGIKPVYSCLNSMIQPSQWRRP